MEHLDELTEAIALGRITAAELGAVPPREQDALYELAARRLDTGREQEAATLLAALVTLFPYASRFWRAYGVACHRLLDLRRAEAAYSAALLLEPGHLDVLCYRGEIRVYLGDRHEALDDLQKVAASDRAHLARRAEDLMELLDRLRDWQPPPRPRAQPPAKVSFTLGDGRPIPREDSRFVEEESAEPTRPAPITREITDVARVFAPEVTQRIVDVFEEPPLPQPMSQERTAPGPPPAHGGPSAPTGEVTATDLIPGRPGARALEEDLPTQPFRREVTRTGIVRRRSGLPLSFDLIDDEDDTGLLPDRKDPGAAAVANPIPAPPDAHPIARGDMITIDVPPAPGPKTPSPEGSSDG